MNNTSCFPRLSPRGVVIVPGGVTYVLPEDVNYPAVKYHENHPIGLAVKW